MESVCDEREVTSFPFHEYAEKLKPIVFLLVSARKGIWPVKLRTRTACGENPGGSWLTWLMWKNGRYVMRVGWLVADVSAWSRPLLWRTLESTLVSAALSICIGSDWTS